MVRVALPAATVLGFVFCSVALPTQKAMAQEALVGVRLMQPSVALMAAQAALANCADKGAQIGVSISDRFGNLQVFIKDRYAGSHVVETSHRKAWTAASFRSATSTLDRAIQPGDTTFGIRAISMALPLGGGLPIFAGEGDLVGAIGVSGAPNPQMDEECAQSGIDAIELELAF